MKKIGISILSALLIMSCCLTAFAAGAQPMDADSQTLEINFGPFEATPEFEAYVRDVLKTGEELARENSSAHPAPAASAETISEQIRRLAYADLDQASAAMQEEILAARMEVIANGPGWVGEGASCIAFSYDPSTGSWTQAVPFHDLYPDWDEPVIFGE